MCEVGGEVEDGVGGWEVWLSMEEVVDSVSW